MKTLEKYEDIKVSMLPEKTRDTLIKLQKATKNFTIENDKAIAYVNAVHSKLSKEKPEYLRSTTAKPEPKPAPKKAEPKKPAVKKAVTKKVEPKKEPVPKPEPKPKMTKTQIKTATAKINTLQLAIQSDPLLQGLGKTDKERDAARLALPKGKRVSKVGWKNQYGASKGGRTYYESRENRSDRKSPEYKSGYPYLEMGGYTHRLDSAIMAKGGAIGNGRNGYVAFYKGKMIEVYADSSYGAQKTAAQYFKAKKEYEVNVMLAELDGKQYIQRTEFAEGGFMAKGGEIAEFRVVPMKIGEGALRNIEMSDFPMAFTIRGSKQEAEKAAQSFIIKNNETHSTAKVTKIHPSGQPLKNKIVSYVTKDEISKYQDGGFMADGKYYVIDAKDGKILSKGFDTEEEAKVEKYKIFENTGIFSLTQKKMADGGFMAKGGEVGKIDEIEGDEIDMAFNDFDDYAYGGMTKFDWEKADIGDSALVIAENKMGVIVKTYDKRFHLRFPDGSDKTYSAEELKFFLDDDYAKGGVLKNATYVSNRNIKSIKLEINKSIKDFKGTDLLDGVYVKKSAFSTKFDADESYNEFELLNSKVWDKLKIESGSQIYSSDALQKKLAIEYVNLGIDSKFKNLTIAQRKKVAEIMTDENEHSLRNYLALRGYLGQKEYDSYERLFEPKNRYVLNPSNFKNHTSDKIKVGSVLTSNTGVKVEVVEPKGIVVTSIKDIPNFDKRLDEGKITYRGLGMGKLSSDFFKETGTSGVRIKVDGKEYFITDEEFATFSRGADGKLIVRFAAPDKKSYEQGGEVKSSEKLPYKLDKYFTKGTKTIEVPLTQLSPIRARETGIENAEKFMRMAYNGDMERRKPISIYLISKGKYKIADGNSTFAVAKKNGWKTIYADVVKNPKMQSNGKKSVFSIAKEIRKDGESWQSAIQRAKTKEDGKLFDKLEKSGKLTAPEGGSSLVGKYYQLQGGGKSEIILFDYDPKSNKPFGVAYIKGHMMPRKILNELGFKETNSFTVGEEIFIFDGNYKPKYLSEAQMSDLIDGWSKGLALEAKSQKDFYRNREKD